METERRDGQSLSLKVNFLFRMVYFTRENPRTRLKDTHKGGFFSRSALGDRRLSYIKGLQRVSQRNALSIT